MISARKILLGMVLMFVSFSTLIAQAQTVSVGAAMLVVEQDTKISDPGSGTISYYTSSAICNIGREDRSEYYARCRTRLWFAFSQIPQGARINSCTLMVTISNYSSGSSKAKVVKMPASYTYESDLWSQFDNSGTVYFTNLQYDQTNAKSCINSTLTSDVQSAVNSSTNNNLTIGMVSLDEGTNHTYADVYATMTINYTPKVTVTIQNSFSGGQIDVDGTNRNSGWSSTSPQWYSGESHTIRAYTQTISGTTYPFPTPGTWTNITTGETKSQTNNNTPVSITPTSNCTWRAEYGTGAVAVTVKNSFNGGLLKVDGSNVASGTPFSWSISSSHTLEAFNQDFQAPGEVNYFRVYRDWNTPNGLNVNNPLGIIVTQSCTYQANFKKQLNISFENYHVGVANGGIMSINSAQFNLPAPDFHVIQDEQTITASALDHTINGIYYRFVQWSNGNTNRTRTESPTTHMTYTAQFVGSPMPMANYNYTANWNSTGQIVTLTWNQHPNSNVSYEIYRSVLDKSTGVWLEYDRFLGSLPHSATSFADENYKMGGSSLGSYTLYYRLDAIYSVENTRWSSYIDMLGTPYIQSEGPPLGKLGQSALAESRPQYFSISGFPNPFNPSSVIKYQLPAASSVSLKIYDMLGREVAVLAEGIKEAGYYTTTFNASRFASGVYIARITATPHDGSKPFIQTMKMLLAK